MKVRPNPFPERLAFATALRIVGAVAFCAVAGGCAVYGGATAVSVRTQDGQVVTDRWSGAAGCGTGQQGGPPCSARSVRERVP